MIASETSGVFPLTSWRSVLPTCFISKRPIAKAFANASWQQQRRAIESLVTLRKNGWKGVNLQVHFNAVTQVEKVAKKCLKPDDWVLDHIQEELAFIRGADLRR
jgi:hypothetical protein